MRSAAPPVECLCIIVFLYENEWFVLCGPAPPCGGAWIWQSTSLKLKNHWFRITIHNFFKFKHDWAWIVRRPHLAITGYQTQESFISNWKFIIRLSSKTIWRKRTGNPKWKSKSIEMQESMIFHLKFFTSSKSQTIWHKWPKGKSRNQLPSNLRIVDFHLKYQRIYKINCISVRKAINSEASKAIPL